MPDIIQDQIKNIQEKLCDSVSELIETERTYVARLMTTYKVSK